MIDYLAVFITFFAVIDPIGTVPVFIAVTDKYDKKTKHRVALLAAFVFCLRFIVFYPSRRINTKSFINSTSCFSNFRRYCFIHIRIEYDIW